MLTRPHMNHAANIVNEIRKGNWTMDSPDWSPIEFIALEFDSPGSGNLDVNLVRAVMTAEAFIVLFRAFNPLFSSERFLKACGLSS